MANYAHDEQTIKPPPLEPDKIPAGRRHANFLRLASRYVVPAIGKPEGPRLVFDIETDGLREAATRIHCIVVADLDSNRVDEFGPDQLDAGLARLSEATCLTGHNIVGFDLPVLHRLHGWAPRPSVTVVDTLITSRLVLADIADLDDQAAAMGDPKLGKLRGRHSLEAWGVRLGIPKVGTDIETWTEWTPELQERCVGDTRLTKGLWRFLQPDGQPTEALALEHRVAVICDGITTDGIPFDRKAAEQLQEQWTARRNQLELRLRQQFPQVTNLNSRQQIARLLEERGWVPEERTEKTRQPKIDDETLEDIIQQYPEFDGLAEHYILGRRLGQLATGKQAWLRHIGPDQRIHGGLIHIGTPHHRAKHLNPNLAQVPNPKKGKPLATECRDLFRTDNDWVFVACDQAGLQDRGFAHYLAEFDGGAYARTFSDGTDTHWQSAIALGLIPAATCRDKENAVHTVIREAGKRFRYAFLYGAGNARAGAIIADTVRDVRRIDPNSSLRPLSGSEARQRFMAGVPGLEQLRQVLDAQHTKHEWVVGLDGRRVPTGAQHKTLNRLVTSSEAIICKRWLVGVHDELHAQFRYGWGGDVVLVGWIHDELVGCCRPEIADQVGEIMVRYAREAGEHFNFKVPLDASFTVGPSWAGPTPEHNKTETPEPVDGATNPVARETGIPFMITAEMKAELQARGYGPNDVRNMTPAQAQENLWTAKPEAPVGDGRTTAAMPPSFAKESAPVECTGQASGPRRPTYAKAELAPNKPYASTCNYLFQRGYRLAERFDYTLPGGRVLYSEDRFELQDGIQPSEERPAKACRFWHDVDGTAYNNTGPGDERIIYGWQAIIDAGPGATVHITEGARKAEALNAIGVLATAVAYHSWNERCINALRGCHLVYHEDHDLPDANGKRAAEKFSADARAKLAPVAASFRILPALQLWKRLGINGTPPHGWDVKDWLNRMLLESPGGYAWELEDICREIKPQRQLRIAPIRDWEQMPTPDIEYGVEGRFPLEVVNLISGEGGGGKSSLVHQLGVAHVLGREWLGCAPRKGPAIYVECEDPENALHWRQKAIAKHYETSQATIADAGFVMVPMADEEESPIMATAPDKSGIVRPTPLYHQLYEMAGDIKPVMIGIASAAIVFAGNEIVRAEVQQFMWLLRRLARVSGGYVLLVTQPSLTGLGDTSSSHAGLSGTTQWHNGSRGRAVLRLIKPEGTDADSGMREIRFYKNQYGALSTSSVVRYNNGLFLPVEGMSMGAAERAAKAEEVFLLLLKKFTAQGQTVNQLSGSNYAPARFVEQTEAAGIDKKELKGAMQRLLDAGMIEIRQGSGKPSRPAYYLAIRGST